MQLEVDLFGEPIKHSANGGGKGYATMPGSGPKGETCSTCKHVVFIGRARAYRKCGLVKFTHGAPTDIKARAPACSQWERLDRAEKAVREAGKGKS